VTEQALTTSYQQSQLEQKDKALELQEQTLKDKREKDDKELQLKLDTLQEKIAQRKANTFTSIINKN
jgi:hypothetical protein